MVPTEQRLSQTSDAYIEWINHFHPTYVVFRDGRVVYCSVHDLDKTIAKNRLEGKKKVDKPPEDVV